MDGPDVGNEGTISSLLLVPAVKFIKVLGHIWQVWLEWQAMVNFIVQAYRMNGGTQETITSVMQGFLAIIKFLMTVLQAWLSGLAVVNYISHAYRIDAPYVAIGYPETILSQLQVILAIQKFLYDMWQAWINGQFMGQIVMQACWDIAIITDALHVIEARRGIP